MAVLLFGVAAWFAVDHAWFRWQSRKVAGEVVELEGSGPFRAIVRYTVEGKTHTVTSTVASYPPAHAVGEEVDVIYDPKDPANARLGSLWEACFFTLVFGLVGAAFLLGSALFRREQRNIDWEVRRRDRRRRGLGSFLSRRRRTRRREGGGR